MPLKFVAGWYLFASLTTIAAFGVDKRRARLGRWRVSERTLHALEAVGGWPGSFVAQHWFRHKRREPSYQVAYWLIVCLHVAGWGTFAYVRSR